MRSIDKFKKNKISMLVASIHAFVGKYGEFSKVALKAKPPSKIDLVSLKKKHCRTEIHFHTLESTFI